MLLPEIGLLGPQPVESTKPVQALEVQDPEQVMWQLTVIQIMGLTNQFIELPGGRLKKRPDFKLGQGHNSDKEEHRSAIVSNLQFKQAAAQEDFRQQVEDYFKDDGYEVSITDPIQDDGRGNDVEHMEVYHSDPSPEEGVPSSFGPVSPNLTRKERRMRRFDKIFEQRMIKRDQQAEAAQNQANKKLERKVRKFGNFFNSDLR